ncbi:SRPBCC family protein [Actinoplanes sp. CA-142083]|uniref:SRPBCC family protein n=1 Tax=Actinoplanes sp. CA-142083 TaxID=3239903 RepID=UPI003D927650
MPSDSRQVAERIDRPAADVYAYAVNPAHIADWAPGLGDRVEHIDGDWFVETGMGRVRVVFAPANAFGVLDHEVFLPTGQRFYNPLRVVPHGDGSEIVFTVRRTPGMSDTDLDRDAGAVAADLARLKQILETNE